MWIDRWQGPPTCAHAPLNQDRFCQTGHGEGHITHGRVACVCAQSRLILGDSMERSPPGSSVPGIPQARVLERVVISSSRGSS